MTIAKYFLLKDYHLDKGPGFRLEAGTELKVVEINRGFADVEHTFYWASIPFSYNFYIPLEFIVSRIYELRLVEEKRMG